MIWPRVRYSMLASRLHKFWVVIGHPQTTLHEHDTTIENPFTVALGAVDTSNSCKVVQYQYTVPNQDNNSETLSNLCRAECYVSDSLAMKKSNADVALKATQCGQQQRLANGTAPVGYGGVPVKVSVPRRCYVK